MMNPISNADRRPAAAGRTVAGPAAAALMVLVALAACAGPSEETEAHGDDHQGAAPAAATEAVTASHPDVKPAVEAGEPVYFCPMHPEVVSAEQGQCDPCGGMQLIEHKGKVYGCPMHAEEVTTDVEADCRLCGMDLEELKARQAEDEAGQATATGSEG